jgi:hypothetical protein
MNPTFTAKEKLRAAEREVSFRRQVYGRKVADGRMTQAEADKQIGLMIAIADDYRAIVAAEDKAGRLL